MRAPGIIPWLLAVTLTAAGAAAAAGYGVTVPERYRATAQVLVSPLTAADPTFAGLDVLRDTAGAPHAAQSVAVLLRSQQLADVVRAQLGLRRSSASLLGELDAHVARGSNVVDVTVEDTSAATAAQLANAFVDALVARRTASFQSGLAVAVHRDAQLLAAAPSTAEAAALARRLAALRSLQGQPDPTLRRATTATAPTSSSWPDLPLLILAGAGIGLGIALAALLVHAVLVRRRPGLLPAGDRPPEGPEEALEALVDRLERRLAAREAALAARERDLQAKIEELRALGPPPARRRGAFDLPALERLVAEHADAFPGRREEWESTLVFLREHAGPDGSLPARFDGLVEGTFGELLG